MEIPVIGPLVDIYTASVEPALANNRHAFMHAFPVSFADPGATMETYVRCNQSLDFCINYARYSGVDIGGLKAEDFFFTRLVGDKIDFNPNRNADQMTPFADQFRMMQWGPSIDEILVMLNREYITDDGANWLMKRHGAVDPSLRDKYKDLRFEIPGPGDLVRFGVREVFHPPAVVEHGYAEEYPKILDKYMAFQGFGQKSGTQFPAYNDTLGAPQPGGDATWGQIFWAAHWNPPSAGQGYQMFQSLYADSRYGPSPLVSDNLGGINKGLVFTQDNLRLLLRVNDYPQPFRDKLTAIAYNPLGRIDVRRLYKSKIINRADVYHNYRRQGYNDIDAERLTRYVVMSQQPTNDKDIERAFMVGFIDRRTAIGKLVDEGFTNEDARHLVDSWDLKRSTNDAQTTVAAIKSAYMGGVVNDNDLPGLLRQAGLEEGRVGQLARNWRMVSEFKRKLPTADKLLGYFVQRIISEEDLTARLQNMRFDDADISLMIISAKMKVDKIIRDQQKQQLAQLQKDTKAKQQQAKQTKATQPKPPKVKIKELTHAEIKSAWAKGTMTEDQVKIHLLTEGMLPGDVTIFLDTNRPGGE